MTHILTIQLLLKLLLLETYVLTFTPCDSYVRVVYMYMRNVRTTSGFHISPLVFTIIRVYYFVHRLPNPPIDTDNPILKASTKPKTRRKLPNPKHPTTHSLDSDL